MLWLCHSRSAYFINVTGRTFLPDRQIVDCPLECPSLHSLISSLVFVSLTAVVFHRLLRLGSSLAADLASADLVKVNEDGGAGIPAVEECASAQLQASSAINARQERLQQPNTQDPVRAAQLQLLHHPVSEAEAQMSTEQLPASVMAAESLQPQLQTQQSSQHQLPHAAVAGIHIPAWPDAMQADTVHLPFEKTQRLSAMLPISPDAAPTRSAALGLDTLSMRPVRQSFFNVPEDGIGRFRQQPQPTQSSASDSPNLQAQGQASPNAGAAVGGRLAIAKLQIRARQMQHQTQKLPPLLATVDSGGEVASAEEVPAIRRRTSFKKSSMGGVFQRAKSMSLLQSQRLALEGSTSLSLMHDDRKSSASSDGGSLEHQPSSSRETFEVAMNTADPVVETGMSGCLEAGSVPVSDCQPPAMSQPNLNSSNRHVGKMPVRKGRKLSKLVMRDALRRSTVEVRACTLQLQAQRIEQQSMHHTLQALNAQTVSILAQVLDPV